MGDTFLVVMLILVAAGRFMIEAAAGTGGDPFRRAAALAMIAVALGLGTLHSQMRSNRIVLQEQDRHDLQNSCVCDKCLFHLNPVEIRLS